MSAQSNTSLKIGKSSRELIPAAGTPLLYFGFAHLCLGLAFMALLVRPSLPGGYFLHPRLVAVVHLVTLGWITSSILGAFYIVGPLALRMPLRSGWKDHVAFGSYVIGVSGMVSHFWIGEYRGMAWSAVLVAATILRVALRAWAGLVRAAVPWPVKLHIALAFANMLGASVFGILIGLNRIFGWFIWSPLSAAMAHAHLATIGWAVMMVVGLSYRLIPMIVPAAMPTGGSMARSALLLQLGVVGLALTLLNQSAWATAAAVVIVCGLASFVQHVRRIVQHKLPSPPAVRRPDWSTWQTHGAFVWLLVAAVLGLLSTVPLSSDGMVAVRWTYAVAGLIGFLAQVVLGIQGRLLPLHGWYRLFEAGNLRPPGRSAHTMSSPALAFSTFVTWTCGVPLFAAGLVSGFLPLISAASCVLLAGVLLNGAHLIWIITPPNQSGERRESAPIESGNVIVHQS